MSGQKPQVVAMGEEGFSRYKNVPDICGQSSCLPLPQAPGASVPSRPVPSRGSGALALGKGSGVKSKFIICVSPLWSGGIAPATRRRSEDHANLGPNEPVRPLVRMGSVAGQDPGSVRKCGLLGPRAGTP